MLADLAAVGMDRASFFRAMKPKPTKRSRHHRACMPVPEDQGVKGEDLSRELNPGGDTMPEAQTEGTCVFCLSSSLL